MNYVYENPKKLYEMYCSLYGVVRGVILILLTLVFGAILLYMYMVMVVDYILPQYEEVVYGFTLVLFIIWTWRFVSLAFDTLDRFFLKVTVNQNGVWVTKGLFPARYTRGYHWAEIGSAEIKSGFILGYLGRFVGSYDIELRHNYYPDNKIRILSLKDGDWLVDYINYQISEDEAA